MILESFLSLSVDTNVVVISQTVIYEYMYFMFHVKTEGNSDNISMHMLALTDLHHFTLDIFLDQRCLNFLRSFCIQHPKPRTGIPFWSLPKVLDLPPSL